MKTTFNLLRLLFISIYKSFTKLIAHSKGVQLCKVINGLKKAECMTDGPSATEPNSDFIIEGVWYPLDLISSDVEIDDDPEWFSKLPTY